MDEDTDRARRKILQAACATLGAVLFHPLAARAAIGATPEQARGPFYPLELPLDKDNDLITVAGRGERAQGEATNIVGRVLDYCGHPVSGARIEIWQANAFGRYHHPGDTQDKPIDPNFQGYGRFTTGDDGFYRFRTIKPVAYPGRAPHIHFALSAPGFLPLITQMYVAGAPQNDRDALLMSLAPAERQRLIADFSAAAPQSGRWVARFDIMLTTCLTD